MFTVSSALTTLFQSRARDLIWVVEFYDWQYSLFPGGSALGYDPRHAVARWAGQTISFSTGTGPVAYTRLVLDGLSLKKSKSKQFDTVIIKVSNVSRTAAAFVLQNRIAGMKLVIRLIPRSAPITGSPGDPGAFLDSIVLFVGRVEKPDKFNRESGTITAKQDLGTIEAQIPERDFQPSCPLKFKKGDCLGNQTLSQKTATYQAAKVCNKTEAQCIQYGNEKYFQGIKIVQIQSSFLHKHNESFFKKVLNILPGISRRKTTVGNSIHDATPYGQPIPVILGRWQKQLIPIQYQDLGNTINIKMAACRGPIKDFLNIRQWAANFSQVGSIIKRLGEYGNVGSQVADNLFGATYWHSRLAYFTGSCTGSDIIVEDPAPDVTSVVAGQIVRKAFGVDGHGVGRITSALAGYANGSDGWTDNPVDLARSIINDPAYLALPDSHIGELATAITSAYTCGVVKDVSNAERCLLPNTETANAGTLYKRYNSTGLIGALSFFGTTDFLFQDQRPGGYWVREATYEFFDPASPPTSLTVKTKYRKRYTANIEINEKKKAIDFLYDTLFASFRGFLRWDSHGRVVIDCERPVDHSFLRVNAVATATSIKVLDVTPWKPLDTILGQYPPLRGKILIGAHKSISEVRLVTTAEFTSDGNAITLSASSTSATMTAVASGATLAGGSSSVAAVGTVTISGSCAVGDIITITVNAIAVSLTTVQEDVDASIDNLTVACQLAAMINAEPLLKEYVEASRTGSNPTDVVITAKYGVLNFATALENNHFAELTDPVTAPTLASSAGALAAGTYLVSYAYRNANGNTNISNIGAITITASKKIDVTGISLPAGATSIDWFVSVEADSDLMLLVNNNNGSGFSINALPAVTASHAPKRNTTGEEIVRVMMSFAGKALTYADTTRANILDGSFAWPEGGRQSLINQAKGTYREAIQDFAEQPITINDEQHQEDTGQVNPVTVDLSAVDNYHQASRLLNGVLAKYRDLDFFYAWGSAGESLLLEVGDVVCASDDSGAWRNVPVTIEDVSYNQNYEASFTARLYSTSAFDDAVLETQVPLPFDLPNFKAPPPDIVFNTVDFPPDGLVQSTDGTAGITSIRGGGIVGDSIYAQKVNVRLIKRGGVTVSESIAAGLIPNSDGEITFEFVASVDGLYTVELEVCNQWGCNTTKPTANIVVGLGSNQGDWVMPMIQLSGTADVGPSGGGNFNIP